MDVLQRVLDVFDEIGKWIASSVQSLMPMFYNETENALTFLGVLAVAGLGFSVIFLMIGLIQKFLHFRG